MAHLSEEDVREAPTTERSFLAGETESVFETTNWNSRNVIHQGFGDVSSIRLHLNIGGKNTNSILFR